MKRKFFSMLMFGVLVTSALSLTSCKDYDDEINDLQEQIDANSKSIETIENLIKSGSVITSVASTDNGVTVTLSDGKTFSISNGKDGEKGDPGTSWTIGDDGYWYKDGVKTDYYALGTKGEKGDKGDQGEKGDKGDPGEDGKDGTDGTSATTVYYVPNADTGCFDLYKNGELQEHTNISFLGTGTITAVMDGDNLQLYGVKGGSNPTIISLSGDLRSLVFIPNLYWDGIETIEYPWIQDTILSHKTGLATTSRKSMGSKTIKLIDDYKSNYYPNNQELINVSTSDIYNFGPTWEVQYHMNPSNANVEASDVIGYNVLNPTIVETRSVSASDVTAPSVNAAGTTIFKNSNGILTVGLKVANPQNLDPMPTDKTWTTTNTEANTVALQVNTKDADNPTVTSDYAMLIPTKAYLEGLIWNAAPMYKRAAPDLSGTPASRNGDEYGVVSVCAKNRIHVWDSPDEALQDEDGAALEMYYNESDFDLTQYLGIHMVKESIKSSGTTELVTLAYGEEAVWGLTYEFNLVDYSMDGNVTGDSRYAKFVDGKKGHLRAVNVNAEGNEDPQSRTAIDREPLVQVLVKNANGDVILDGYILIHITSTPIVEKNTVINDYPETANTFDLCNDKAVLTTNWSQFNKYVLTDGLDNMTKNKFDELYEADLASTSPIGTTSSGDAYYSMNIYEDAPTEGNPTLAPLGIVAYYPNTEGTTNHRFTWTLSADEMEELTHDLSTLPVTVTRYVAFKKKTAEADYKYVFIKMQITLTRAGVTSVTFGEKNNNYWYGLDGSDDGLEAIVLDVEAPRDDKDIINIEHEIRNTLVRNNESITDDHKYYFVPDQLTSVVAQDGNTYTITPQSSASDGSYNQLYCLYVTSPIADKHDYDRSTLDELLNKCVINYNKGAFTNNKLYAKNGSTYTLIAELNQSTGVIKLVNNSVTKLVLNAVGYEANHTNIQRELSTWIGVTSKKECGTQIVKDDVFLASWQRPINMKEPEVKIAIDANTNENIIYILDFLKLYDWRGETEGYMWDDHTWFWAYYNVNKITIDMRPTSITTNMNNGGSTFVPMSDITTKAKLYAYDTVSRTMTQNKEDFNFSLYPTYDSQAMNAALVSYMEANKGKFGAIYYANNGENVTDFSVRIPVTLSYEWGDFEQVIQLNITRTTGN